LIALIYKLLSIGGGIGSFGKDSIAALIGLRGYSCWQISKRFWCLRPFWSWLGFIEADISASSEPPHGPANSAFRFIPWLPDNQPARTAALHKELETSVILWNSFSAHRFAVGL
jgi:hypothetical protein